MTIPKRGRNNTQHDCGEVSGKRHTSLPHLGEGKVNQSENLMEKDAEIDLAPIILLLKKKSRQNYHVVIKSVSNDVTCTSRER